MRPEMRLLKAYVIKKDEHPLLVNVYFNSFNHIFPFQKNLHFLKWYVFVSRCFLKHQNCKMLISPWLKKMLCLCFDSQLILFIVTIYVSLWFYKSVIVSVFFLSFYDKGIQFVWYSQQLHQLISFKLSPPTKTINNQETVATNLILVMPTTAPPLGNSNQEGGCI